MNSTGTCSARKGAKGRWTPEVEQDMVSSKVNTNCITRAVRARPSARPAASQLDSQAQTTTHCLCADCAGILPSLPKINPCADFFCRVRRALHFGHGKGYFSPDFCASLALQHRSKCVQRFGS